MTALSSLSSPSSAVGGLGAGDAALAAHRALASGSAAAQTPAEAARRQAKDFEAMFLNTMVEHMFTETGEDGPLGNGPGTGVWRSFLVDAYTKGMAENGGIGIADQVYPTLLGLQEARAGASAGGQKTSASPGSAATAAAAQAAYATATDKKPSQPSETTP
ncbi:Flagellar protein FlgJ [Rhodovulum sp. PH10]|uniref:rod-binding protein n=1 Tax=Rhodovulum sp. PH10 TaxID=1187851 RepID=UPI00027C2E6C|nr:rod-binding protein [Rhodovulum sp. PH10]EJW09876.1 Flagellar protein FlgJ [Rhodovulum sp. PH10]